MDASMQHIHAAISSDHTTNHNTPYSCTFCQKRFSRFWLQQSCADVEQVQPVPEKQISSTPEPLCIQSALDQLN